MSFYPSPIPTPSTTTPPPWPPPALDQLFIFPPQDQPQPPTPLDFPPPKPPTLPSEPPFDLSPPPPKQPRPFYNGKYLQRLQSFNRYQQKPSPNLSLDAFWKPLIANYFTPDANLLIELKSSASPKPRQIRVPVEALPRICKSKVDAGLASERTILENPYEIPLPNGLVIVECPNTVILTTYSNSVVQTDGRLRVTFQNDCKITMWEFFSQHHQELFPRSSLMQTGRCVLPRSTCSEYGIPVEVDRLMMIANDMNNLADKIAANIATLVANPSRLSLPQKPPTPQPSVQPSFTPLLTNGTAYRALSSILEPNPTTPLDPALPRQPPISDELDPDTKSPIESDSNLVPGLTDPITSWRSEPPTTPMFSNLFEDAIHGPFAPEPDTTSPKPPSRPEKKPSIPQPRHKPSGKQRKSAPPQSAIEAVAAAAMGKTGGWEEDGQGAGAEGDGGLQLLTTATDASLTMRPPGAAMGRGNLPEGLSLYTGAGRRGRGETRGGRKAAEGRGRGKERVSRRGGRGEERAEKRQKSSASSAGNGKGKAREQV